MLVAVLQRHSQSCLHRPLSDLQLSCQAPRIHHRPSHGNKCALLSELCFSEWACGFAVKLSYFLEQLQGHVLLFAAEILSIDLALLYNLLTSVLQCNGPSVEGKLASFAVQPWRQANQEVKFNVYHSWNVCC